MTHELVVRNALLRGGETTVDIAIADGSIREIGTGLAVEAEREIDAGGRLVTESFANPHLHLDKVYTLERLGPAALAAYHGEGMGAAMSAIELASRVKEEYDESWILPNVRRALRLAARYGNTHIRAFADVDTKARLVGVEALLQAREEFRGIVDVQVVAFPQDGVVRDPGAAELVRQAMELGADVVGGIPWIEYTEADEQSHIEEMFDIAEAHDADISMLLDDAGDPGLRSLEKMAVKAIATDRIGRCLAHHARAMCMYPEPYFRKLVALLKRAGVGVVSDPQTGPLHARVKEL
ncbi:MAG: amidohydrolase family protein, partial [Thermoanaerobaculia bacterium]